MLDVMVTRELSAAEVLAKGLKKPSLHVEEPTEESEFDTEGMFRVLRTIAGYIEYPEYQDKTPEEYSQLILELRNLLN